LRHVIAGVSGRSGATYRVQRRAKRRHVAIAVLCLCGAPYHRANAAENSDALADQLQEIVVTAQKRESTVQETPISVTAVTGEDLEERGITSLRDLVSTGVSMNTSGPGQVEFEMRGISSAGGSSPTVGFYLGDVPLTAPNNVSWGKSVIDPDLYDLNRVEVLRGPQGTLYGAGSMGGTIKVVLNQPDPSVTDASVKTTFSGTDGGGFNHTENVMANLPLGSLAALRVVGTESYTSGWIDRVVLAPGQFPLPTTGIGVSSATLPSAPVTGGARGNVLAAPVAEDYHDVNDTELYSARASLLWKPTDQLTVTPSVFFQRMNQGGPDYIDSDPGTLAHYEVYNIAEPVLDRFVLWSLDLNYKFENFDVSSTTADFTHNSYQTQDASEEVQLAFSFPSYYPPTGVGAAPVNEDSLSRQFSEEVRLTSTGQHDFNWLIGGFLNRFSSEQVFVFQIPGAAPLGIDPNFDAFYQPYQVNQVAAFGEVSYQITSALKATAGLRRYWYTTTVDTVASGYATLTGSNEVYHAQTNASDHGYNPKIDLSYEINPGTMVYANAAKGFRPGGGNTPVPTGPTGIGAACLANLEGFGLTSAPLSFAPDTVWSYELGEKFEGFNNRLTVNSAIYYETWNNVQQNVQLPCGLNYTENAGRSEIHGGELEVRGVLLPGLVLSANVSYTHARITEGSVAAGTQSGFPLQNIPTWTSGVSLQYKHPISSGLSVTAVIGNNYMGSRDSASYFSLEPVPGYDLTNIHVGLAADRWSASLFASNVLNKRAIVGLNEALFTALPSYNRDVISQPLTIGIDLGYHF
jgi:iron complex outermembrane recepter protein